MPVVRFLRNRIVGYRLEILSNRTMEWMTAYEAVGKAYSPGICDAVLGQAIKDPEVLEIKLFMTHDHELDTSPYDEVKPILAWAVPKLEEPKVVQHVRLRWRAGR
jgi:hypothetical protein